MSGLPRPRPVYKKHKNPYRGFATRLLLTLAHPQNKGASRTVRDALVSSFIADGNPAALLLPCDTTLYNIAEKVLSEKHIENFVMNNMDEKEEFSCVSIDGHYKVPMSLVGQPKHGTTSQSETEKHVLETIMSKTSCLIDVIPLFSERALVAIKAVCATLGVKSKYVLALKTDNAAKHDTRDTFKMLKNLRGVLQDPLHRVFKIETEYGGHRSEVSTKMREIVRKFSVPCTERHPVYYTYRTKDLPKFQYRSTYERSLENMTKRRAKTLIKNVDAESPFRKPAEYFELLAAVVVHYDDHFRNKTKLNAIVANAATVKQYEYLQNNARFLKQTSNAETIHDGTTANERMHFCLLGHFANVRYQTLRHLKIALRSFVVRQMLAWHLAKNVEFASSAERDQRSGTILKRFISSAESMLKRSKDQSGVIVRKRPSCITTDLRKIAVKKTRSARTA